MNLDCGVYILRNTVTGLTYVGSSKEMRRRWGHHLRALRRRAHKNGKLQNSFNKHGESAWEFEPLLFCAETDLQFYEQLIIDGWGTVENGYNLSRYADAPKRGRSSSEETKRRTSRSMLGNQNGVGHAVSEAHREAIRKASIGNQRCKGRVWTKEMRETMSKAQKLRYQREGVFVERIAQLAEARKQRHAA